MTYRAYLGHRRPPIELGFQHHRSTFSVQLVQVGLEATAICPPSA